MNRLNFSGLCAMQELLLMLQRFISTDYFHIVLKVVFSFWWVDGFWITFSMEKEDRAGNTSEVYNTYLWAIWLCIYIRTVHT